MAIKNKNRGALKWKFLSVLSLLCSFVPLIIFSLWIYVFNNEPNHSSRVIAFKKFFSEYLQGQWDAIYLGQFCCAIAIILSGWSKNYLEKSWQALNLVVIILSSLLFIVLAIGMI